MELSRLGHMYMTYYLYIFSAAMVAPAVTDVTVHALCPGNDKCSLAIYLTGFQQGVIGLGSLVALPIIGNLSDKYGRKALLTVPMVFTVLPLAVLAYSRSTYFYYTYYILKTVTAIFCGGTVHFIGLSYLADHIPAERRASAFGIFSGIGSAAHVCGNLSTRFLPTQATFQVSTAVGLIALVYMRILLPDSVIDDPLTAPMLSRSKVDGEGSSNIIAKKFHKFKSLPSMKDTISLLRSSRTILQVAIVTFFSNLADVGLHASMMYYLKARFSFDKTQFADLSVITGISGTISQLLIMPILAPLIGDARLLSIGLFFASTNMFVYSITWAAWVPYAAAVSSILFVFTHPCMQTIVSKQVGSSDQGKVQGCLSGICSLTNVISPLVFSPLTALFISDQAPFNFPGFSFLCLGLTSMVAFAQSLMINSAPPILDDRVVESDSLA